MSNERRELVPTDQTEAQAWPSFNVSPTGNQRRYYASWVREYKLIPPHPSLTNQSQLENVHIVHIRVCTNTQSFEDIKGWGNYLIKISLIYMQIMIRRYCSNLIVHRGWSDGPRKWQVWIFRIENLTIYLYNDSLYLFWL